MALPIEPFAPFALDYVEDPAYIDAPVQCTHGPLTQGSLESYLARAKKVAASLPSSIAACSSLSRKRVSAAAQPLSKNGVQNTAIIIAARTSRRSRPARTAPR